MSEYSFTPDRPYQDINPRLYETGEDVGREVAEALQTGSADSGASEDFLHNQQAGKVTEALVAGRRAFISPAHLNYEFMVRPGILQPCYPGTLNPVVPGVPSPAGVEMARVGDIKARFEAGILIIDTTTEEGQTILKWAESKPDICRDVMDDRTEIWAAMKRSQLNLTDKAPSLPPNIDVDKIMDGDYSGFREKESLVAQARQALAQA